MRVLILCIILINTLLSQSISIHGLVCEKSTNEPIIGVNVFIEEQGIGCSTDENGYFTLVDLKAASMKLLFPIFNMKNISYQSTSEKGLNF